MSFELRAPGWLARHPLAALILFVMGLAALLFLGYQLLSNGPLIQFDMQLQDQLHATALKTSGLIVETMTFGFFLGKEDLQILGAILVVYFLYKRFWPELGMVLIGWMGGSFVWTWLIQYFNRPRPADQIGMEVRTIPSFPSGHTMFATLAFGLMAYMLVPKMPSLFWKWVVVLTALAAMAFVGYSRLFEGGHYFSDVLAGYAVGLAWGTLVYTVLEAIGGRGRV